MCNASNVNDFSDEFHKEPNQDGYFQSNFNSNATYAVAHNGDYSNSMEFMPIQAPYSTACQYEMNPFTSEYLGEQTPIIPNSYAQQHNFHRHSQHGYTSSHSTVGVPSFESPPQASCGGMYQGVNTCDQLPRYYTQQFM